MVRRGQCHMGADEHIVPQCDGRYVQKYAVVIDETVLPHMDVHAVLAVKGRKDLEVFSLPGGDQPFQSPLLGLGVP